MVSTYYMFYLAVITYIQTVNKNNARSNFNQSRHMIYYRGLSMEQEENKHKTSPTGKVKDGRDTNSTIN